MAGPSVSVRRTAIELADVLGEAGFTPEQAEAAEPYTWAWAATSAGHDETPDDEMRQRAVRLLRSRESQPDDFALFKGAS